MSPLGPKNRKGEISPLRTKRHDNDHTSLLKLIRDEHQRKAANLPLQPVDTTSFLLGDSEIVTTPTIDPAIGPPGVMDRGNDVLLHFHDHAQEEITPLGVPGGLRTVPYPQGMINAINGSWLTPVYNYPISQARFVQPVVVGAARSGVVHTYTSTADSPNYQDDMDITAFGAPVGTTYEVELTVEGGVNDLFSVWRNGLLLIANAPIPAFPIERVIDLWTTLRWDAPTGHSVGQRWEFESLSVPVPMAGGTTVFKVVSDDDYCAVSEAATLLSMPAGYATIWIQGLDLGDDGDRKYFLLDAYERFQLYYERDSGVGVSKLVFIPNTAVAFQLEIDIGTIGPHGWFGYLPNKISIQWDFSSQTFELFFNDQRAWGEPTALIPMPEIAFFPMSIGNSYLDGDLPSAGAENAYQYISEMLFSRLSPGLDLVTSINGVVAQSLIPRHDGWFTPGCCCLTPPDDGCFSPLAGFCEPLTPINLGSQEEPFDEMWVRKAHIACYADFPANDPTRIALTFGKDRIVPTASDTGLDTTGGIVCVAAATDATAKGYTVPRDCYLTAVTMSQSTNFGAPDQYTIKVYKYNTLLTSWIVADGVNEYKYVNNDLYVAISEGDKLVVTATDDKAPQSAQNMDDVVVVCELTEL